MSDQLPSKIPPQNLEAEQSLLGSLLLDKHALDKIADIIDPDDFYKEAHRYIYEGMVDIYSRQEPIDLLTITNLLEERNHLKKVGGRSYLANLANIVPTASHVIQYAHIIKKKATLRRLQRVATEIVGLSSNEDEDIDKLLDLSEQKLFTVSQRFLKQSFTPISNILGDTFDRIDDMHKNSGQMRGLASGFTELDTLLAGFQKSDLIVLAARPSVGKTSIALDMVREIGIRGKVPVGIFSLEMSKEQVVDRLLCAESNVDLWKLRTGRLSDREDDDDFPRLGHAMGLLSESPIFIDDSATLNVMEIRTKARRLKSEHNLGMIVIDYLQLMEARANSESRVQAVAEITRALKGIARELDIPVLALSQLSRAVEMNKPAIPKLANLRESGSIEQDADVVLFIYRKASDRNYRDEELTAQEKHIAEVHIAKHRNGPTGLVKLFFDGPKASFRNLDKRFSQHESSFDE
ncbi:replicative DNA helicase [Candidatus Falkowbacteria bacterium]|jgi:replicative DNA helicase|nr:replicative DNA helicase [Candidatus Falkowbacteria bacterium]MBT5503230.1 replicative DNA helicase [Candidatus Falkowbacteria bacterium]MBT6574229.1 replicative DNA helicase [Candidatus Falkowbacteria bacterium]MBT7348528.1 replicative DNA helicase [Candidatus Falkowbacteria bacterium]MBT7500806.1 replicative DNA helicase [Candidatus Falkowbacteria bacterium]